MRSRSRSPACAACFALWLASAGCATPVIDLREASPTPTATPTPTPIGFGDGHDGAFTPSSDAQITVCRRVESSAETSMQLDDATGLTSGVYLVWQVQDDAAPTSQSGPLGAGEVGDAGLWELVTAALSGNVLTTAAPLLHRYDSNGTRRAQACRLPEYTDVTITGVTVSAVPWDGDTGGVVGFLANGTVTVDGAIRADAAGFRGGALGLDGSSQGVTADDTSSADGGGKGEGIDARKYGLYGRANYANGAGGGNARDAGGGGGGGAGAGGNGGRDIQNTFGTSGRPGVAFAVSAADRLFFGGGGGAGHQSNSTGSAGGNGGGLVLILAAAVAGTGAISADGESAALAGSGMARDGAGGGGAGGTIFVQTSAGTFAGSLSASGGDGGDCDYGGMGPQHGPGGGGGGGRIRAALPSASADVAAGSAGTNLNGGGAHGASDGSAGVVE